MTTSPVMGITEELLAELEEKARAAGAAHWIAVDGDGFDIDHRLITTVERFAAPTCELATIKYGHPNAGMLEPFQSEQVAASEHIAAANPATILALIAHIRTLEARMDYIDRNFVCATFDYDGDGMAAMVVRISGRVSVCCDAMAVLDAAIAQEGQSHE